MEMVMKLSTFVRKDKTYNCPGLITMEVLSGKWKLLILWLITQGVNRFGAMKRTIPNINQGVLTRQLKELESSGLLSRHVYPEIPPRVEYELTELGVTLQPVIFQLCKWGKEQSKKMI
jgi:DNA-binding HxlR family transcriptional regulator